jgi:hypothetical protein
MLEIRMTETARAAAHPASIAKQVLFSGKSLRTITSNQIANIMVGLLMPALTAAVQAETRDIAIQQVTITSIAITRYWSASQVSSRSKRICAVQFWRQHDGR